MADPVVADPAVDAEAQAALETKAKADAEATAKAEAEASVKKDVSKKDDDFMPAGVDKQVATRFAEKVRKQEKAKLYPKVEKLEKEMKAKSDKLDSLEAELTEARAKNDELSNKGLSDSELLTKQVANLTQELTTTKANIDKEKAESEARTKNAELQAYRERALRDAGTNIIPDLVQGSSEEEIDSSLETAKGKYNELYEKALAEARSKVTSTEPSKVTNPEGGASSTSDLADPKVVKEIPLKDWKEKRAEVLAAIKKAGN